MTKTPEQVNQYIHEAIHGESSWSKSSNDDGYFAIRLKEYQNPNYLEHGKPWGEMLNWARKQKWWGDFIEVMCQRTLKVHEVAEYLDETLNLAPICVYEQGAEEMITYLIVDPEALATKLTEYLEGLKDE